MNVLVIDVGGTHIKYLATGQSEPREFASGKGMSAREMVEGVKKGADGWHYEAVAMGYPGMVIRGRPVLEPANLGKGWVGFDFEEAFGRPVKIINDAAMQALGSFSGGRLLFLGLGTGLGAAVVVDGVAEPMELAHMPYRKATFEHYVGKKGLARLGKARWRKQVTKVVDMMFHALDPTEIVIGGGNVKKLKEMPPHCRAGDNSMAFTGGFRLWQVDRDGSVQPDAHPTHGAGVSEQTRSEKDQHPEASSPETSAGLDDKKKEEEDDEEDKDDDESDD